MTAVKKKIEFDFQDDVSKRGKPVKYVHFSDPYLRLSDDQIETLKKICKSYFFYAPSKKMWGFVSKGNNEINVYNFLKEGLVPEEINEVETSRNGFIRKESIPFNVEDFEIEFIELTGRPLFYYSLVKGKIKISINLKHWFFENGIDAEKEFAKKMALSLVGTELEFTSPLIESFFIKLNSIQENLKYTYDKCE